jgi:prepilin-type N-terminal cleavage/methylation domain-containing protein
MMKRRQSVKCRLRNSSGFTLIEVIAVLIIIAIITAVAVSRSMSTQNDLIQQVDIVKTHLRFAQLKALNDDVNTWWSITFSSGSYALSCTGSSCPASTPALPSESSSSHGFPSGVTATSATVNFDKWGSPGGNAVGINLTQGSQTITITVAANTGYITP